MYNTDTLHHNTLQCDLGDIMYSNVIWHNQRGQSEMKRKQFALMNAPGLGLAFDVSSPPW